MTSIPVWPVFVPDFLSDLAHVSNESAGAYLKILMITWRRGGRCFPLRLDGDEKERRADEREIARILGCTRGRWVKKIWPKIAEFFDVSSGELRNRRLDDCLAEQREKAEKARENGRKGGRPRNYDREASENPGVFTGETKTITQTEPKPSPSPSLKNPTTTESDAAREEARRVVVDFVRLREGFWPSDSRLTAPRTTLETQARGYLDSGASAELCAEVMERVMRQKLDRGEGPPTDLRFCHRSIESAAAGARAARAPSLSVEFVPGQPERSASIWRSRMKIWQETGEFLHYWDIDHCPAEVIVEHAHLFADRDKRPSGWRYIPVLDGPPRKAAG